MTQTQSSAPSSPFHTVRVALGARSYHVVTGDGTIARLIESLPEDLRATLGQRQVFIITDQSVGALYAASIKTVFLPHARRVAVHSVSNGEGSKSFTCYQTLCDELLAAGIDRKSLIVALGGGVVGDLAGFVAATILRGIDFIQIPTTLLSQVDSSVGGKTGINSTVGKNLIGAFYQPRLVVCDGSVLATLPPREFAAGMAEIIKAGLLADADFFAWIEQNSQSIQARDAATIAAMINRAVEIKAGIVAADEREETGLRATLNLGHTFAHAYEAVAGYDGRLLHGEAVGLGLVLAAQLSFRLGLIGAPDVARIRSLVGKHHLPVTPRDLKNITLPDDRTLVNLMRKDKKASAGQLNFIVLEKIGRAVLRQVADENIICNVLTEI